MGDPTQASDADPLSAWETLPTETVRARTGSGPEGLTLEEAAERLRRDGPNTLPRKEAPPFLVVTARQFVSPLIAILALAAIFAAAIGEWIDAGFIVAVLAINALIGGIQEWRAEKGAHALQQMLRVEAIVERQGERRAVDAATLVVGDIVWLESGQRVPADLRLVHAQSLEVDESLLTGESTPVTKDASWTADAPVGAGDRKNGAHAGSMVVHGRASGIVVATGLQTEVGRIATDVLEQRPSDAPLVIRMRRFARVVGVVVLAASALLATIGIALGEPTRDMLLFAVAVAVSAVPEGLPVALTVALAVGTGRMAKRNVIVRRLAAVEGLGSCTFVASDKTGTLTMNALTVREVRTSEGTTYAVTGEGFSPEGTVERDEASIRAGDDLVLDRLAVTVALCNEAELFRSREDPRTWDWKGDPTDVALLAFAAKIDQRPERLLDEQPRVAEIPFEPERRYAASVHQVDGDQGRIHVKGAPERVIGMCTADPEARERWLADAERMAAAGMRVLAIADGPVTPHPESIPEEPSGLTFLGFVGMIDPPRPGVPDAIRSAQEAGIQVVMVTGDHPTTATAIAASIGIPTGPSTTITGSELEGVRPEQMREHIHNVTVYARVAPHQKLQIVQAAQDAGHFVAVTGDGVNDAPALRAGNIGVAMGKGGTDVAREVADIVLADDAFPSVVAGVEEGRVAYRNVRNVVFLLVSTGAAELVLLFLALTTGSPIPLLPAQLLWLNLVTNGIQDVALGMEPGRGDERKQAPRHPKEPIFNHLMIERTIIGAITMGVGGFLTFRWLLDQGWDVDAARNGLLLLMVLFENVHVGNARSETKSAFSVSPFANPFLLWGVVIAQLLHIAALYVPFMQTVLRTQPVTLQAWSTFLVIALSIALVFELHKLIRRRWPVPRKAWPERAPGSAA